MTGVKIWLTIRATLMLLFLDWSQCLQYNTHTVDPPEDVVILDPGHLGLLQIQWSLPVSLLHLTECSKRFQLEYLNTYQDRWTAIRTANRNYSAQFDLNKEVRVRVYTLLRGPCTNDSEIKSSRYTERVQQPLSTDAVVTTVQGLSCVFYKMEYTECYWKRGPELPANSLQTLYFWHRELKQTAECPEYIISNRVRSGCNFTGTPLPIFTDINLCVNGSSPDGTLRAAFFSLQIQNHVKPAATEILHLLNATDHPVLHWESPPGRIPSHCLEWEVEHHLDGPNGKHLLEKSVTMEMEMTLTRLSTYDTERNCFRVRSRLHEYCADEGFWSEWSQWTCHPDEEAGGAESGQDAAEICALVAVIAVTMLMLTLCVWALCRKQRSRQEKKLDPVFANKSDDPAEP